MSIKNELVSPRKSENVEENKRLKKEILTRLGIQDPEQDIQSLDKINLLLNCIYVYIPDISDEYNLSSFQGVKLTNTLKGNFINNHFYKFFEKVMKSDLLFEYSFQIWLEIIESEINKKSKNQKNIISTLPKEKIQNLKSKMFEYTQTLDFNIDINKIIIENSFNFYVDKDIKKEKVQRIIDLFIQENIIDQSTALTIPQEAFRIEFILLNLYYKSEGLLSLLTRELRTKKDISTLYTGTSKGYFNGKFDIFNSFIGTKKYKIYNEFASKLDYFDISTSQFSKNIKKIIGNNSSQDQNIPNYSKAYISSKKNLLENLDNELVYKEFGGSCKKLNKLIKGIPDLILVQLNNNIIQSSNYFVLLNFLLEIKHGFHNYHFTESKIKEIENQYHENILNPIIDFLNQNDLMIKLFVNDIYEYIELLLINQKNGNLIVDKLYYENKNYKKILSEHKGRMFGELYLGLKKMLEHNYTNIDILNKIFEYLNGFLANNNIAILDLNIIYTQLGSEIITILQNYTYLQKSLNNNGNINTSIIAKNLSKRIVKVDGDSKPIYNKTAIDYVTNPQIPTILETIKSIVKY